jgi:PII-like signaling protein
MSHSILKIYASNTDRLGNELLYEHVVYLAKNRGLSGVTVYRGIMGFGMSSSRVSSTRFWELTEKLPVVIEVIDKTEKIEEFFNLIEEDLMKMPKGCLVTTEQVQIIMQKKGSGGQD